MTLAERPHIDVAVVMRRDALPGNRWKTHQWVLDDVVPQQPGFGDQPRLLMRNDQQARWLHPGFRVELFRDDAEGYYLNATSPAPCWFVLWRMDDGPTIDTEPIARPAIVTLSYHDAGRWLDAQETVENVPAPPDVVQWMLAFAQEHYVPEPKRRKRPESFRPLQDRFGNPVAISTGERPPRGRQGDGGG